MANSRTYGTLYKRGRVWYWKYRQNGVQVLESLGVTTKAEAEHERARRINQAVPSSEGDGHSFADFDAVYWPWAEGHKSPRQVDNERPRWKAFQAYCGVERLEECTPAHVELFKAHIKRKGLAGRPLVDESVNNVLRDLQAMFNHARKLGVYAGENPFAGVTRYKLHRNPPDFLTPLERDAIFISAAEVGPVIFDAVVLARFQGMRLAEIMAAHASWFDLDARIMHIPSGAAFRVKTKKGRSVPLSAFTVEHFRGRLRPGEHLFSPGRGSEGKGRYRFDPVKQWNKVRKQAGVDRATWLLLRHTFGSELAQKGVPLIKIARWMGNTLAVCERHYVGLTAYDNDIDKILD